MNKPAFLLLTKAVGQNAPYRENFANVRRYYPHQTGTQIEYLDGNLQQVKESCEQIDQMIGTIKKTDSSVK